MKPREFFACIFKQAMSIFFFYSLYVFLSLKKHLNCIPLSFQLAPFFTPRTLRLGFDSSTSEILNLSNEIVLQDVKGARFFKN